MKFSLILLFLSFTIGHAFAQIDSERWFYLEKSEKYRRMKNTGTILTLGGTVLVVAGMTMIMSSSYDTNTYYGSTSTVDHDRLTKGVVMYVVGAAGVGAGIPLWIVGGISHGKYNRKLQQLSARVAFSPRASGLRLTYRF